MRIVVSLIVCLVAAPVCAQGVVRKMSENKFEPVPGLPSCLSASVQSGDPGKGASVILFKGKPGCRVPWHWHTPAETVMIVSGSAKFEMKDHSGATVIGPGGYAMMPSKHVHQFTCVAACTGFVTSDSAFDIHYLDASGKEIPPESALGKKGKK